MHNKCFFSVLAKKWSNLTSMSGRLTNDSEYHTIDERENVVIYLEITHNAKHV